MDCITEDDLVTLNPPLIEDHQQEVKFVEVMNVQLDIISPFIIGPSKTPLGPPKIPLTIGPPKTTFGPPKPQVIS